MRAISFRDVLAARSQVVGIPNQVTKKVFQVVMTVVQVLSLAVRLSFSQLRLDRVNSRLGLFCT